MKRDYLITGIQQVGIGVSDADAAFEWYKNHFGFDLPIFNDEAEAKLMVNYTGGEIHSRKAYLALNVQGGGGFEIWQFSSREPSAANFKVEEGMCGITSVHLKSHNLKEAYSYFKNLSLCSSEIKTDGISRKFFEMNDPYGNAFKIIEDKSVLLNTNSLIGGVIGLTIGVSDIEASKKLYSKVLNHDTVLGQVEEDSIMRTWLSSSESRLGTFSNLLGSRTIELVQSKQKTKQIFENRYWGDLGYIHVCFDVQEMCELRIKAKSLDFPFTVDSEGSFEMGEAAGQFAYIEDTDKTLIELVETHKIPVMKKWNWYLTLKGKKNRKPLANWMLKALALNRVRN
jgi:catechol 2,3-dioxygenase-like lactoylglutathione lyase family enzyme